MIAGGIDRPRGAFSEAIAAAAHRPLRRQRLHRPARRRPPRGQPRHRPRRRRRRMHGGARSPRTPSSARPTPRWRSPPSSASRPPRSSPGPTGCRAPAITLPVHIGVAGPAKLQTMLKFAMACGVGPSLRVLQRRAADLTKLMLPFEPTEFLAEHRRATRRRTRTSPIERVHFFPLGGITATTDYAGAAVAPAAAGPRRWHDAHRRCCSTSTAPSSTPTICTTRAFARSWPSAAATSRSTSTAPTSWATPTTRSSPASSPARTAPSSTARRRCSATASPPASSRSPASTRCSTGPRPPAPAAPSSPTRPRDNAVAMLAAAEPRPPAADAGHRRRVRAAEARPRALPGGDAPRSASRRRAPVAFEDSRSGLRAARASGAHRLRPDHRPRAGRARCRPARTQVIADFTDPALWAHLDRLKARVA